MKKVVFIFLTIFCFSLSAQYYTLTYVMVAPEDVADFEEKEIKYWSQVALNNVKKGKQMGWSLLKKFGTAGNNDVNYAFVNSYSSIEDLINPEIWGESVEELGYKWEEISTKYKVWELHTYRVQDMIPGEAKVYILNYGKPKNLNGFISENKRLWKPYHQNNIASGTTGMKTWGIGTKIYPSGNNEASVMTWDGFDSIQNALEVLDFTNFVPPRGYSKMHIYDPDGFRLRVIWQELKSVPPPPPKPTN